MNVSEQLLEILKNEGVSQIFGVAGDALNPLVSAIGEDNQMQWVRMKHEANASFAAFAQGELSSNLGVCASTVGPGALHLVNGLYNAKKERSPVLAITGQIPLEHQGTAYHQEVNLSKVFDDICEYQAVIKSPEEAPRVILRAIRIAVNENSVCRIELPADVARMKAANTDYVHKVFRSRSQVTPVQEDLMKAAELLNNAEKVGILAGAGCRTSKDQVLQLSKMLQAPITHTLRAADVFDHDIENVVGLTGLIGNPSGYKAVMDADVLLMLGTDFPYTDYLPEDTKTIQVDLRPENIGNRTSVDLGLHGHIGSVLTGLLPYCHEKPESAWLKKLRQEFTDWKKDMKKQGDPSRDMSPIHPQIVADTLSQIASPDAIFAIDTGTSAIWSSNFMSFYADRRIVGSFNHGSMAVGLPAAIGAQLLYPEREVWGLIGDGAFNMSLQDFSTAVEYELPVKLVIFNNAQLGFVKIEMEEEGLAPNLDALEVNNLDMVAFAESCGARGLRIEQSDKVLPVLKEALEHKGPVIIDARVTDGALSLPPKITSHMAFNFAKSKTKELVKVLQGDKKQWQNIKNEVEAYFD